jgi:hypothetical protein
MDLRVTRRRERYGALTHHAVDCRTTAPTGSP